MNQSNSNNDDVFLKQKIEKLSSQPKDVDQAIEKLLIEINSLKDMTTKKFQNYDSNIQEIKTNAKQQEENFTKDLQRTDAALIREINRQQWLQPSAMVTTTIVIIGTILGACYHFTSRIESIDRRMERVCHTMRTLTEHTSPDPEIPDCLP